MTHGQTVLTSLLEYHAAISTSGSIPLTSISARATSNSYFHCRFNQYSGVVPREADFISKRCPAMTSR